MKSLKKPKSDAIAPEKWKNFDGCPVCKLMEKAAKTGTEISGREVEEAFDEAERQADV